MAKIEIQIWHQRTAGAQKQTSLLEYFTYIISRRASCRLPG